MATGRSDSTLTEAQGYFDLGMYVEAWQALDDLPIVDRPSRSCMALRLNILRATNRRENLVVLSEGLTEYHPRWPDPWFHLAACNAKAGKCGEAKAALNKLFNIELGWREKVLADPVFEEVLGIA